MNTKSTACIVAFLTNDQVNKTLRLQKIGELVENGKLHAIKLSVGAFLFDSLEKANDAVRIAAESLEITDEFLIFPVERCLGSFSSSTEKALQKCHQESVLVPLLCASEGAATPARRYARQAASEFGGPRPH